MHKACTESLYREPQRFSRPSPSAISRNRGIQDEESTAGLGCPSEHSCANEPSDWHKVCALTMWFGLLLGGLSGIGLQIYTIAEPGMRFFQFFVAVVYLACLLAVILEHFFSEGFGKWDELVRILAAGVLAGTFFVILVAIVTASEL